MARPNLWGKSVPRVELDHRARDARIRLARIERLLVPRVAVRGLWLGPLARLLGLRVGGNGRGSDRTTGSFSNRQRGCMPEIESVCFEGCGTFCFI